MNIVQILTAPLHRAFERSSIHRYYGIEAHNGDYPSEGCEECARDAADQLADMEAGREVSPGAELDSRVVSKRERPAADGIAAGHPTQALCEVLAAHAIRIDYNHPGYGRCRCGFNPEGWNADGSDNISHADHVAIAITDALL